MARRGTREHPPETVFKAQELYCVVRLTYREVAQEMDVAESTLKRWAAKYDWSGKRAKIAQAECDLRADFVLARSQMLKRVIETSDPQAGFAVSALESLAMKQAEAERAGKIVASAVAPEAGEKLREITTPEDAVSALEEAVEIKLNRMLADPDRTDLKDVKAVTEALGVVRGMHAEGKERKRGLTPETAEAIRQQILFGGE